MDLFKNLKEYLLKCYFIILFLVIMLLIKYYIDMFGGDEKSYRLKLLLLFKKENLKVYVSFINIRYNYRKKILKLVGDIICSFINKRVGNYMIFLFLYVYMELLWDEMN